LAELIFGTRVAHLNSGEATLEIHRLTSSELHSPLNSDPRPETPRSQSSVVPPPELDLADLYCILQVDPNDSFMALELAKRLRAGGRLEECLKILKGVLKIDYRFETLHALGQVEYQMDMIEEAFTHLQGALLIAPENSGEFFELFKTMGNIFVRRGDLDSAEDSYNKAHRLSPESDVLFVNFGTLFIQRQSWDEAASRFRKALSINGVNDKAWVGLAICHRLKGDFELAWGNIEAALEYNPLNEVALGLALEWGTQDGREFRALELIRCFLIEGGWNEKMSLAFAWLSWRRGDTRIARLELERLLAVNPTNETAIKLVKEIRERP
jgi:tetratricopeptide (TPR) repeat protein